MDKTIAQEALELLEPIPAKEWIEGNYEEDGQSCALGWYAKKKYPKGLKNGESFYDASLPLRVASEQFILNKYKLYRDIADVNNDTNTNNYKQKTIKNRVIALLKDMVKAGY
jgi:hypothetical protein